MGQLAFTHGYQVVEGNPAAYNQVKIPGVQGRPPLQAAGTAAAASILDIHRKQKRVKS
jgi:hypothetical protein